MLLLLLSACNGCAVLQWDYDGDGFDYWSDCDDGDAAASPLAEEVCNGVDDDCDGVIDDVAGAAPEEEEPEPEWDTGLCCVTAESPESSRGTWWFADRDGDGFGSEVEQVAACELPEGFVEQPSDCDDADASVYPGAPDACGDGVDQQCDGVGTDCCEVPATDLSEGLSFALDGAASFRLANAGDVDDDGTPDVLIGASADTLGGMAWLVSGSATGAIGPADAIASLLVTAPGEYGWEHVAGDVDWDGDGATDVLVNPYVDPAGGQACLFRGPFGGPMGEADRCWSAERRPGGLYGLDTSGDLDGDGTRDLVTAAPFGPSRTNGEVYVIPGGSPGGDLDGLDVSTLTFVNGQAATVGDIDGDGIDDLLASGGYGQELRLARGPIAGTLARDDLEALVGFGAGGGFELGPAGDIDGDGLPDAWAGRSSGEESTRTGSIYVWRGPLVGEPHLVLVGESAESRLARATSAGDLDEDGHGDLVLATNAEAPAEGWLYVVTGAPVGVVDVSCLDLRLGGPLAAGGLGAELVPLRVGGDVVGLVATAPAAGVVAWVSLDVLR